jgi:thymidylate synthase ThyX
VSQRYVEVKPGNVIVPPLHGEALSTYEETVQAQMTAYQKLVELLQPVVHDAYFTIFPARRGKDKYASEVKKKAQEVARYVLPIGTFAYMYHTVSVVTLLRYHRTCLQYDTPLEQREVVEKMMRCLLEKDPQFEKILEEPVGSEENPEFALLTLAEGGGSRRFAEEFDGSLDGLTSKLIDWKARNEEIVAQSVREVFGLTRDQLSDDEALERLLDPARNPLLGSALNLSANSKLMRAMVHAGYTFRKKMSHAGDSQDQRHRTIPASRPCLQAHLSDAPDYIEPGLVRAREEIRAYYRQVMERTWESVSKLRRLGVSPEFCVYLLPNAVAVRFTESADLLNLRHKMAMRLCYNAQEEIWKASLEEATQICKVNPRIGKYLLPPCSLRYLAKERPICPEGNRYCGVPVWTLDLEEYERLL